MEGLAPVLALIAKEEESVLAFLDQFRSLYVLVPDESHQRKPSCRCHQDQAWILGCQSDVLEMYCLFDSYWGLLVGAEAPKTLMLMYLGLGT